jgi:aspartyl protease family protein
MFRFVLMAGMMLVAGVVAVRFVDQAGHAPASVMAAKAAPEPANSRTMVIKAGDGGHFAVEARVDGRRIDFMVDTGASHIALRESDAARLGIHPTPRDYNIRMSTANGEGRAARVELRMVEVGNIIVRDLPALVVPDNALNVNLLGMSFLSRVRWTHEKGKLVLEQ